MNATSDAPGANDDGSGTAAVIEAARVLSKHRFPATIVYARCRARSRG
jgi:Zn-dependent M28 family amino/carboxypeptidase